MKSLAESVLENHALYHSAGCNMAYWESRFDRLAARAKKELEISETDALKVRESSPDDDLIAGYVPPGEVPIIDATPRVIPVNPTREALPIDWTKTDVIPVEYVEPKSSNLF